MKCSLAMLKAGNFFWGDRIGIAKEKHDSITFWTALGGSCCQMPCEIGATDVQAEPSRCKWSKYMGGWYRVSNKNQPHISSIKFLKNRDFFIVVRRLHLSKALWNCLRRLHHLSKGCGIVSLVYITYRKGVELSPSSTSPIERVS